LLKSSVFDVLGWVDHGFGTHNDLWTQDDMARLKQIHSATVLATVRAGCAGEGDGLVTSTAGLAVSIRTADCFPVLLVDARLRTVAAVHAGWRGTAAQILPATVDLMRTNFDTRPEDIYAAIGPGIGECCYQVGEDVARHLGFTAAGRIDLGKVNYRQLVNVGVPEGQIDRLNLCTFCNATQFHSYRRDKDAAGRMISFIRIPAADKNR